MCFIQTHAFCRDSQFWGIKQFTICCETRLSTKLQLFQADHETENLFGNMKAL